MFPVNFEHHELFFFVFELYMAWQGLRKYFRQRLNWHTGLHCASQLRSATLLQRRFFSLHYQRIVNPQKCDEQKIHCLVIFSRFVCISKVLKERSHYILSFTIRRRSSLFSFRSMYFELQKVFTQLMIKIFGNKKGQASSSIKLQHSFYIFSCFLMTL